MGRISEFLGIGAGSLGQLFKRCAGFFKGVPDKLIQEYRKAPVKHADETVGGPTGKTDMYGYSPRQS